MRLFSEKVNPTFNSSGYNILTVKDYTEVFFDVYEFEINGSRFVAEKTGVLNDSPIVSIPVDHNNIVEQYDFVLHKGSQSIHFDPSTTSTPSHIKSTSDVEPLLVESVEEETDEVFLEDKKVAILEEIEKAKVAAAKYISQIEKQNKRELVNYQTEREVALKEDIDKQKKILLDEFYTLVEELRDRIAEESIDATLELKDLISDKLKKVSSNVDAQIASAERAIDTKIEERANELLNNVLLSEVKRSSKDIADNLNSQVKTIAENISKSLTSTKKQIEVDITEKLQEISTELNAKDKAIVELNDNVNKQSNRALSRIGTVKTQLESTVKDVVDSLEARIDSASDKLTNYYSEKLQLVEASLSDASEHTKNHIIGLIKESYQSLQDDIANIKVTVPNIVIEKSNGKQEIDVAALRTELEKSVSSRFVNEISSLKRLIELSSGGGSVAMQFAAGGTMNGNLNVTGQYLSAGVDLLTIFSGGSDDTYVNTLVRSNSANWDGAYNTSVIYQSNSANYATIDFTNSKFFPLSGGIITGSTRFNNNVTIQGNLTAIGTTTFSNTIFSVTSALSVVHIGAGPAMWVGNNGTGDIASFYDIDQNIEVLHVGGINSTFPNVGVHTSTPNERFTVSGNISASGNIFTRSISAANLYSSGNVGIGTTTPNEKLTVVGNISATGNLTVDTNTFFVDSVNNRVGIGTTTPGVNLQVSPLVSNSTPLSGSASGAFAITSVDKLYGLYGGVNGSGWSWLQVGRNDSAVFYNLSLQANGGNVGVGTTTPNEKLTVVGNISASGSISTNNKVTIDSLNAVTNPKLLITASTATGGTGDDVPFVIKGSGINRGASINLRTTGGSGELYNGWITGRVGSGIQVNSTFVVSNGISGPNTGTVIFSVTTGSVGVGITTPNAAAMLDVTSTTRGFLPPRMTTVQRDAITSVPAGLMVYNTTTNKLNFYNGSAWEAVTSASATPATTLPP